MRGYQTNLLYETTCASRTVADTPAPRAGQHGEMCMICREEVRMISAETAAMVCQCSRRKIYRWIEEGDLHFIEKPDGEVMICGSSLSRKIDQLDNETGPLPPGSRKR